MEAPERRARLLPPTQHSTTFARCYWRLHAPSPSTEGSLQSPRIAGSLKDEGNAAFTAKDFGTAIRLYTKALDESGLEDMPGLERAKVLLNRSNAHFSSGDFSSSRKDALASLSLLPNNPKALYRLALAEEHLGNMAAAVSACAAGAMHGEPNTYFAFFTKQARRLGAWRLPPPLAPFPAADAAIGSAARPEDEPVASLRNASRAAFLAHVARGEPVILRDFADVSGWSWRELLRIARASEAGGRSVLGDVLVSASGCVPDYRRGGPRGDSAHASRIDTMTTARVSLVELLERVSGGESGGDKGGGDKGGGDKGGGSGEGRPLAPLLCPFEKVYSYGKGWMLDDAALRTKAHAAWPRFIVPDDLCDEGKAEDKAEESGGGEARSVIRAGSARHSARSGQVCWVGSAGCLTPLHYDMSDGLLAQVIGTKRVWLFAPTDMDRVYLRSPRRPGIDNWERQSEASLHGEPSSDWPKLSGAKRFVADLEPGDCLYIPSQWLHEVHSRTASFSLGWRVAMRNDDGSRIERNADQKIERMAASVKAGSMTVEESLMQALSDPHLAKMLTDPNSIASLAKGLTPDGGMDQLLKAGPGGGGGMAGLQAMLGSMLGGGAASPKAAPAKKKLGKR
jgi:hypothetical protein